MKKLQEIDRLVEEAMADMIVSKYTEPTVHKNYKIKEILHGLADKVQKAIIDYWYGITFSSNQKDGQVEETFETKQEEKTMVDKFYEYLKNTPKEQLQKDWDEVLMSYNDKTIKPALQPLPEEMPEWYFPDVTELYRQTNWDKIRQHFGAQPREWWQDLKKGDKFYNTQKEVVTFNGFIEMNMGVWLGCIESPQTSYRADSCSPYTDLTQSFRDKLTPELQAEFDKLMKK